MRGCATCHVPLFQQKDIGGILNTAEDIFTAVDDENVKNTYVLQWEVPMERSEKHAELIACNGAKGSHGHCSEVLGFRFAKLVPTKNGTIWRTLIFFRDCAIVALYPGAAG